MSEMHTRFSSESLKEDLGVNGRKILNRSYRKNGRAWTGFIWLRTGTTGVPLETW
jgi:hypothetical protein